MYTLRPLNTLYDIQDNLLPKVHKSIHLHLASATQLPLNRIDQRTKASLSRAELLPKYASVAAGPGPISSIPN